MGCYIETENETKQEFLNRMGKEVFLEYIIENYDDLLRKEMFPVCSIKHTKDILAVAVLYNKQELERLLQTYGINNSKNKYYIVSLDNLRKVSPIENFLM